MENRQLSYAPAQVLFYHSVPSFPVIRALKDLVGKQIVVLCHESAKTVDELSKHLATAREYIEDELNVLLDNCLVSKKHDAYTTHFPLVSAYDSECAKCETNRVLLEEGIPEELDRLLDSLEDRIRAVDFYGNHFEWKYIKSVFCQVVDRAIGEALQAYHVDKCGEIVFGKDEQYSVSHSISVLGIYSYADDKRECPAPQKQMEPLYVHEKEMMEHMLEDGFLDKSADSQSGTIPVFTREQWSKIHSIVSRAVNPCAKKIAEKAGPQVEKIILPHFGNRRDVIKQFYTFWMHSYLLPTKELYWYGVNAGTLAVPEGGRSSTFEMYKVEE